MEVYMNVPFPWDFYFHSHWQTIQYLLIMNALNSFRITEIYSEAGF